MKRILVISGSRADAGLLEWPLKCLREDGSFKVSYWQVWNMPFEEVFYAFNDQKADLIAKDQTDALLAVFVKVFNELRG